MSWLVLICSVVLLGGCGGGSDAVAEQQDGQALKPLNVMVEPGNWDESDLAAATSSDFGEFMVETLSFAPGDCRSRVLIHRYDAETRWADGRTDSLCSEKSWITVWRPSGDDWWEPISGWPKKLPLCGELASNQVPVDFYSASLGDGKCRAGAVVDYEKFVAEN